MNKKRKILIIFVILLAISLCIIGLYEATKKVVYIEYAQLGTACEEALIMDSNNHIIEQEFEMPYPIFYGLDLKIGTFARENNSQYEVEIVDKTTNTKIANFCFNTSYAKDDEAYSLMLENPMKVDMSHQFSAKIKAKSIVNGENSVAFYVDKNTQNTKALLYNNQLQTGTLCMNIFGGNTNSFWIIFTVICEVYSMLLLGFTLYLYVKNKKIKTNSIVQASILGIAIFLLMTAFVHKSTFSDEADNIIGGMLIEKGEILYHDYYSQHTPFAYFLCAFFSLLKPASVVQFRLIYNVFIALFYVFLYIRHHKNFGNIKMAILPFVQIAFGMLLAKETTMILSDNIQAIALISLVLEFLQYLKDEKLGWKRSMIVSLSIFCSFTSAFVSVYAIFAIGLGVFFKEISYWMQNQKITLSKIIRRYWKLAICAVLPFVILFLYFVKTHTLKAFYEQAFKFNTQVYPYYLEGGFGANIMQPFLLGITNFLQIIPNALSHLFQKEEAILAISKIIIAAFFIQTLFKMFAQKKYLKTLILSLLISFEFTRISEPFHEIAVWSSMLAVILVHLEKKEIQNQFARIVLILFAILIFGNYANICAETIFQKQNPISQLEKQIIENTSEGEKIFHDIYSCQSVYLIYKNRLPMNHLTFILPWYMDWYELETVDDLSTKKPRVVVYDENLKVWEISGYDDYLRKFLHENYQQTENNSKLWILK